MGCCVSSNNNDKAAQIKSNSSQQSDQEETVKEVLSETPNTIQKPRNYTSDNDLKISSFSNNMELDKHIFKKPIMNFNHPDHDHDLSEDVSEVCSSTLSENTEVRKRSLAKSQNHSFHGERNVGNSPARRTDPSLGRVRPGFGSGSRSGSGRDSRAARKDNGECSGRRSRSPAMRMENGGYGSGLGRSPSVRKTGKSPSRVRSELGDRIRKMEEEKNDEYGENKWPPTNGNDESLENPLVSLECFIFL